MAIEELPDTVFFRKLRIPLTDFIVFSDSTPQVDHKGSVTLEHPRVHFRSRDGLYLTSDFCKRFSAHFLPRPLKPSETQLFVWILKKNCKWAAANANFQGDTQLVPWWVIRPFLKYASSGDHPTFLASDYHIPFFMGAKGYDDALFKEAVSLRLSFGTLHSEWWIQLFCPGKEALCHEGQSFLSVL